MAYNDLYSFRATIPMCDIDKMRKRIMDNIAELNLKRNLMLPSDFTQLMNHHQYILNIYNNIINVKKVEQSDPFAPSYQGWVKQQYQADPNKGKQILIYNPDGTTRFIEESSLCKNEEWEAQFDKSLLLNPPSYVYPPNNVYNINLVKRMGNPQNI